MITAVARTGWMNLRRDRAAMILSFVVPIVFFSIFAVIFGSRKSSTSKVTVAVADEDHSKRSSRLIEALKADGSLNVLTSPKKSTVPFDAHSVEAAVRAGDIPAALVIPKGFGESSITFGPGGSKGPAFQILADSSDPVASQVLSGILQKTVMTSVPDLMMSGGIDAIDRYSGGLTTQQRSTLDANMKTFENSSEQPSKTSTQTSLIRIETRDILGESKKNPIVAFYAAGVGVMFMLFTASGAAGVLLEEHENGTIDRILSTRVTLTSLLGGKLLYLWMLGVLQLIVMFTWGMLVFKLDLIGHLAGCAIMTAATGFASSTFGLLLASVARTRQQLSALVNLVVLSISAIGGSMFPRFLMPEGLQKAGLVLFNAWALEGFTRVFWREEPLTSLTAPVVFLILNGVLFFAIARRLTRRWEIG
jgi:ABC-2 type transport system permease protein